MKRFVSASILVLLALSAMLFAGGRNAEVKEFDYQFYGAIPTNAAAKFQNPQYLLPPQGETLLEQTEFALAGEEVSAPVF